MRDIKKCTGNASFMTKVAAPEEPWAGEGAAGSGEGGGVVCRRKGALGHMAELAPRPTSPFQMSVSVAHERWRSSEVLPGTALASASVCVRVPVAAWYRTEFVAWRLVQRHFVFNFRNSVSRKIFAI